MQKLKPTDGLEVKAFVVQTMYLLCFELIRYIATVKTNRWFGIEAFFCSNNEFVSFLIYWIYCEHEPLELILCTKWNIQVIQVVDIYENGSNCHWTTKSSQKIGTEITHFNFLAIAGIIVFDFQILITNILFVAN